MNPTDTDELTRRLVDLEVKAAFTEDLVDRLNDIVAQQQGQLDRLMHEVRWLRQQAAGGEPAPFRSLREELPPHY